MFQVSSWRSLVLWGSRKEQWEPVYAIRVKCAAAKAAEMRHIIRVSPLVW